jgi:hypothetical protein
MTEQKASEQEENSQKSAPDSWSEVGDNFKSLGGSLAAAFKETWENEELSQKLRKSMDSLADGINHAVREAKELDETQQVRGEMGKAAKSVQDTGAQAFLDVKPHIVSSLRQLSAELKKMTDRLEREESENTTDKMDVT